MVVKVRSPAEGSFLNTLCAMCYIRCRSGGIDDWGIWGFVVANWRVVLVGSQSAWPDGFSAMRREFGGRDTGALAQLGERLHGMQEVEGSIPLGSIFL